MNGLTGWLLALLAANAGCGREETRGGLDIIIGRSGASAMAAADDIGNGNDDVIGELNIPTQSYVAIAGTFYNVRIKHPSGTYPGLAIAFAITRSFQGSCILNRRTRRHLNLEANAQSLGMDWWLTAASSNREIKGEGCFLKSQRTKPNLPRKSGRKKLERRLQCAFEERKPSRGWRGESQAPTIRTCAEVSLARKTVG